MAVHNLLGERSCVETWPIGCMKWTGEHGDTTFDGWITLQRKNNLCPSACRGDSALLLTLDVWHLKLFGDDSGQEQHDERHVRVENIMWDVAKHVLKMNGDVVLDYGCWARVERDDYRNRAKELGADFKPHYMDVSYSELYRRLEERNRNLPAGAFEILKAEMDRYITIFQPPTGDELV